MPVDANRVILIGENPFIRLSENDGDPAATDASFWRIIQSPHGAGHVLYLKSELTEGRWRIFTDNLAMARWLQETVQGMLNAETADLTLPATTASFKSSGDAGSHWREHVEAAGEEILLEWQQIGEPLLLHTQPDEIPGRRYGVCTILIPCAQASLTLNGTAAKGRPWPRDRDGRPFSTCCLAFAESWTEKR